MQDNDQRELDVLDRGANRLRAVDNGVEMDAGRDQRVQVGECRLDVVDRVDDVGAGLLEDEQHDRGLLAVQRAQRHVLRGADRVADVAHANRRAVAIGDDDVVVGLRLGQLIVGGDGEALLAAQQRALGRVGRGVGQRAAHVLESEPARRQPGRDRSAREWPAAAGHRFEPARRRKPARSAGRRRSRRNRRPGSAAACWSAPRRSGSANPRD